MPEEEFNKGRAVNAQPFAGHGGQGSVQTLFPKQRGGHSSDSMHARVVQFEVLQGCPLADQTNFTAGDTGGDE